MDTLFNLQSPDGTNRDYVAQIRLDWINLLTSLLFIELLHSEPCNLLHRSFVMPKFLLVF